MSDGKEYLEILLNDIDRLGIKGNYSVEDLFNCQDLRFIKYSYNQLKQENKQLKKDMKVLFEENSNKEQLIQEQIRRIDKAVEVIDAMKGIGYQDGNVFYYNSPEFKTRAKILLEILKGDSNDR